MPKFSILSLALVLLNSSNNVDAAVSKNVKKLSPVFKSAQQKLAQTPRYRRKLEDAEEEEEEEELSFISGYNMLYQNCFVESRTVSFKLCPRDDNHRECDQEDCEDGGEYVVDMEKFLDAFTEAQMEVQNYKCEMARENCEGNYDDDAAVANCYVAQGGFESYEEYTNSCEENENDEENEEENFNLQEYLECKQFDDDYYVGPSCADSVNIYLALFTDEDCLYSADVTPQDLGYDMPYSAASGTPIITEECASCLEHRNEEDQNGGNDEEDANEVIEQCEQMYEEAEYKCETSYMTSDYHAADSSSCEAIAELKAAEQDFQERGGVRQASGFSIFLFTAFALVALGGAVAFFKYGEKKKESDKTQESFNNTKKEGLIA